MSAGCQRQGAWLLHCLGAAAVIAVCAGSLALAGSPQVHQLLQHNAARTAHSCAIALPKAGKLAQAIKSGVRPLVRRTPVIALTAPRSLPSPVWIPKLFLEAC